MSLQEHRPFSDVPKLGSAAYLDRSYPRPWRCRLTDRAIPRLGVACEYFIQIRHSPSFAYTTAVSRKALQVQSFRNFKKISPFLHVRCWTERVTNTDICICIWIPWSLTMSRRKWRTENYRAVSKAERSILRVTEYLQYLTSYKITDDPKYLINKTSQLAS